MSTFDIFDNIDEQNFTDNGKNYFIEQGARMGIGANLTQTATKAELRARGLTFGNEKFSAIWRGINDEQQGFNHFSTIGVNETAIDSILPQKDYFNARYRYVGQFKADFGTDGSFNYKTLAIDYDEKLTPNEVLGLLREQLKTFYTGDESSLASVKVTGALHNPTY